MPAPAGAAGRPDRALRGHGHDAPARGVCRLDAAGRSHGAARGCGECPSVVRSDVRYCKASHFGVAEMKKRNTECRTRNGVAGVVAMVFAALVSLALPLSAQTSLSIYRDGRVVVRRTLPQALQQGRNALTLRLEALDPATLFSTDTSVGVVSATVRYPSTSNDALGRAVGQTLSFVRSKGDTIRATVVRADRIPFA